MHRNVKFWCNHCILFFVVVVVACSFGVMFKEVLTNPMSYSFPLVFYSEGFIVLALLFRFLIHFELIFVYGIR